MLGANDQYIGLCRKHWREGNLGPSFPGNDAIPLCSRPGKRPPPQLEPQQEPGLKRVLAVSLNGFCFRCSGQRLGSGPSHPIMV